MNAQIPQEGTRFGLGIRDAIDPTERPWPFILGHNLGNPTLLLRLPFEDFLSNSFIPNEANIKSNPGMSNEAMAQRPLSIPHALSLGRFILKGILKQLEVDYIVNDLEVPKALERLIEIAGPQPYMALQPVVANLRNYDVPDLRFSNDSSLVFLGKRHILYVIDGQHRYKGIQFVREFVSDVLLNHNYPRHPALLPELSSSPEEEMDGEQYLIDPFKPISPEELEIWDRVQKAFHAECTLMLEVHLGLDADEERQLFHDLNNLAKKVEVSMAQEFDQSNPVNLYIRERLGRGRGVLEVDIVPYDKKSDKDYDGKFTLKDITAINAILFLNRFNTKSAVPTKVKRFEKKADAFWRMVNGIPGITDPSIKTVATQSVILKALANLYYLFSEGKIAKKSSVDFKKAKEERQGHLQTLIGGIANRITIFDHDNPMWRYYDLSEDGRAKLRNDQGVLLSEYLPKTEVPIIGAYDPESKTMKFATQHNSIFPILGDMIRWQLCLPKRPRRLKILKLKRRR